jgi:hypothetical protein
MKAEENRERGWRRVIGSEKSVRVFIVCAKERGNAMTRESLVVTVGLVPCFSLRLLLSTTTTTTTTTKISHYTNIREIKSSIFFLLLLKFL